MSCIANISAGVLVCCNVAAFFQLVYWFLKKTENLIPIDELSITTGSVMFGFMLSSGTTFPVTLERLYLI